LKTPIDDFHDYTHTDEFIATIRNNQVRNVLNELADMAKALQNMLSADFNGGVTSYDRTMIEKHLRNVTTLWRSIKVKKR